jgi:hypothetical protein
MYKIITMTLEDESVEYVIYNVIKKREVARYSSYEEAFQDIIGR